MTKADVVTVTLAAAITSISACVLDRDEGTRERAEGQLPQTAVTESAEADCGPDVMDLWVQRDPDLERLIEESQSTFSEMWLAQVRCLAEKGEVESQRTLGIVYRDGSDGPPQNYAEAAAWFVRAAEQGHPMAQYNLGRLYESGRGVPQNLVRAHMWHNLAASGFDWMDESRKMAFSRRDELESRMTPAQIREAQILASEWWAERTR